MLDEIEIWTVATFKAFKSNMIDRRLLYQNVTFHDSEMVSTDRPPPAVDVLVDPEAIICLM